MPVPLSEVCRQDRESIRAGERSELRYLGMESIEAGGGYLAQGELSKVPEAPEANTFRFTDRHVLYGKLRPYLNKVWAPEFEGKCSTELVPLLPNDRLDRHYLAFFLRTPSTVEAISNKAAGARMPRADMAFVMSLAIPLPSIDQQRRIVDLLSRAENVVRMRREAAAKAKEIIPALFRDMFGDPSEREQDGRGATSTEAVLFGNLGTLDRGKSRHRPRDAAHLYGGVTPFIQTGDVARSGGAIDSFTQTYSDAGVSQSRVWPAGTLCITIAANIANTGVLGFDACFPDSVVGFMPGPRVRTEYIQEWLGFLRPTLEAQAPQAAQKNINLDILRNLRVSVPLIGHQDQFAAGAASLRNLERLNRRALEQADAVFQSLLTGVFEET